MKKLFISQPMAGKTDEEIKETRKKAIEYAELLLGEKVEVIESFFEEAPAEAKPLWFLGKSIELLSQADIVYFVKGWDKARGCKIEHQCAVAYGIKSIAWIYGACGYQIYITASSRKMYIRSRYCSKWTGWGEYDKIDAALDGAIDVFTCTSAAPYTTQSCNRRHIKCGIQTI